MHWAFPKINPRHCVSHAVYSLEVYMIYIDVMEYIDNVLQHILCMNEWIWRSKNMKQKI